MKITIEIADVNALSADGRLALLTLMQIRTNERPAERVARQVAASPGVPIAADDVPSAGQVPVPDHMPEQVPTIRAIADKLAADIAESPSLAVLFGGQAQQPAASTPSVPAIPPVPSAAAPAVPATASPSLPVPPAAAPVPSAGGSVAAPPAPTNALDKRGLPWDQRIHASTKAKNADGSWRQKRGVDPAEVERVEQSLRELVAIPAVPQPIPPAVPAVPVAQPLTYQALMAKAIEWTSAVPQQISMPQIFEALQTIGVKMLPDLQHRPDLVQPAHDAIVARMAQAHGG
jgi:hypothetical protein